MQCYHHLLRHAGSIKDTIIYTNIHIKTIKHNKTRNDKNELYAQNMSTLHLSPYFYYSVLCSDQILMLVLISKISHCI